jgi:division protein CdvB (Snf7/Vps24/ESCRT-III family)
MELNIIKQIKSLRQMLRHKPKSSVEVVQIKEKLKELRPVITRNVKRKPVKVNIDGVELSLKEVAQNYGLNLKTVEARYRVGNRGKLLTRPSQMLFKRKKPT